MVRWLGYGNPVERDPDRVLADVIAEKITLARPREIYAVVIDISRRSADKAATVALRKVRAAGAARG